MLVTQPLAPMPFPHIASRRAFALAELLSLCVILAAAIAALALTAHDSRRRSRQGCSIDNLRFFGSGTQSYAADNASKFWTFNWRAGAQSTEFPDLNHPSLDLNAGAYQAVYIIRTLGESPQMPRISGWFAHARYSHLALWQHLGLRLPTLVHVSPEDRALLLLQRNANLATAETRVAYSSSYETGSAFYSPDAAYLTNGLVIPTVSQGPLHYQWLVGNSMPLGYRTLDEVRFPSHKAHVWDSHQRDLGSKVLFYAMRDARVPVLTVDGSAGIRATASTNYGFRPSTPLNPSPTTFNYAPGADEPPAQDPSGQDLVAGHQRWTRWGLRGRDFNGPEATAP